MATRQRVQNAFLVSAIVAVSWGLYVSACGSAKITDGAVRCSQEGSCPSGFACAADDRCYRDPGACGDGELDPGETCDPPGLCPESCSDGNSCTVDSPVGVREGCTLKCAHILVETCSGQERDDCCPAGCSGDPGAPQEARDIDCSITCGDGTIDEGETCDPPETCDTDCDDMNNCTNDELVGSVENCNALCLNNEIVECSGSLAGGAGGPPLDGCCPSGCSFFNDRDCALRCEDPDDANCCGNNTTEPGESCDGDCPTLDECPIPPQACLEPRLTGSALNCNVECGTQVRECGLEDGCCLPPQLGGGCFDPDCIVANEDAGPAMPLR